MENTKYSKYKDKFKKMGIFNIFSSICAFIFILLLIFVKSFVIKEEGLTILQFSVYDEAARSIKNLISGDSSLMILTEIYSVFAFLMLLCVVIMAIVELIKNILNITNLERYALTQYDNIKRRGGENSKKRRRDYFSVSNMLYTGIALEITSIFLSKFYVSLFSMIDGTDTSKYISYFASVNGISFNIIFPLIFAVVFSVLFFIMRKIFKDIKYEIMKEEYGAE